MGGVGLHRRALVLVGIAGPCEEEEEETTGHSAMRGWTESGDEPVGVDHRANNNAVESESMSGPSGRLARRSGAMSREDDGTPSGCAKQ